MKASKTYQLNEEKKVTGTITYSCEMVDRVAYADGDNINLGREPYTDLKIEIFVNGNHYATFSEFRMLKPGNRLDADKIEKGIYGETNLVDNKKLQLTEEAAKNMARYIEEVKNMAIEKTPEYKEYINAEAKKEKEEAIKDANEIISLGDKEIETHGSLMTMEEIQEWQKEYNDVVNEGGDGYIPRRISREEYEAAKKTLTKLS